MSSTNEYSAEVLRQMHNEKRTWTEDAGHENGRYQNRCVSCEEMFIGHKRRVTCKVCATIASNVRQEFAAAQSTITSQAREIGELREGLKDCRVAFDDTRLGYRNLLEFRKVGDRYGNLTREELEAAIGGMDAMLKKVAALLSRTGEPQKEESNG